MPRELEVTLQEGPRMSARVGQHEIIMDQPASSGGTDQGATPAEVFMASIAACQLFYAYRVLERRGIATEGISVSCQWTVGNNCIESAELKLRVHEPLDDELAKAVQRAMDLCFVKASIELPMKIDSSIE